jgi:hypothetical protein
MTLLLLIAGARIAGWRMEAELGGQLEGRRPEWLGGGIPAAGHGLHIVEDEHPGH